MKDIMGLMKQAKEMQEKMMTMQQELGDLEAQGTAGGGMVKITLSGKGEISAVTIDPSMFKEDDVEILEDLVMAAHNDAKSKVDTITAEKTAELTAGLPIPPGMKMPFG